MPRYSVQQLHDRARAMFCEYQAQHKKRKRTYTKWEVETDGNSVHLVVTHG